jgi:hypothetical protein
VSILKSLLRAALMLMVFLGCLILAGNINATRSTPKQFADSLCYGLSVEISMTGYVYSDWTCRPYHKINGGVQTFQVWVTEKHQGHLRHYYIIMLPDGTVLDFVRVSRIGATGNLKA